MQVNSLGSSYNGTHMRYAHIRSVHMDMHDRGLCKLHSSYYQVHVRTYKQQVSGHCRVAIAVRNVRARPHSFVGSGAPSPAATENAIEGSVAE